MYLAAQSASRMASFSLEEFGDLVSSALDLHAHIGSNLDLAFGSQLSLAYPQSDARQSSEIDHDLNTSYTQLSSVNAPSKSSAVDDVHARTNIDELDSHSIVSSNETRRLASSSSPTLALNSRPLPAHRVSRSVRKSMSMSRLDMSFPQHQPASRASPFQPPEPPTPRRVNSPHPSSAGSFKLPSLVPSWAKQRKEQEQGSNNKVPRGRLSSMSFFSLKLKSFPKLSRKPSKTAKQDCDGLRSFFEDIEEEDQPASPASRSPDRQLQSSLYAVTRAAQKHNIAQSRKSRSKGLPPTFDVNDRSYPPTAYNQWDPTTSKITSAKSAYSSHRPEGSVSGPHSLFYQPPSCHPLGDGNGDSVPRFNNPRRPPPPPSLCIYGYPYTPRYIPSPLSSPSSPLPPAPSLATVPLPCVKDYPVPRSLPSKAKADDTVSVNSDEIMSWRGVRFESTSDGNKEDPRSDAPSMIPRCTTPSQSTERRRSWNSARTTPKPRPQSGIASSNSSKSASARSLLHPLKLASASFVSLRSATGMTNSIFKSGCDSAASLEWGSDRDYALASGRVLTPDEDPFAGPQLPSPASSCSLTQEIPLHPYAAVDHAKSAAVQLTPKAEKTSKSRSQEGGNVLQTPFKINSTPKKRKSKTTPLVPGSSPRTPTNSRQSRKERGLPLSATSKKRNSFVFPLPPTPASMTSGSGSSFSDGYFKGTTVEPNVLFPRSQITPDGLLKNIPASFGNEVVGSKRAKGVPKLTRNGTFDLDHSDSRPHSPFPLRCLSNVSVSTALGAPVDFADDPPPVEFANTSDVRPDSNIISEHDALMFAPTAVTTDDAHALAEAYETQDAAREMASSTAWFLDSDSDSCADEEVTKRTENSLALESDDGDLEPLLRSSKRFSFWDSCSLFERQPNLVQSSIEPDSRTETSETSEEKLTEPDEAWPLPPHRTIVVDESSEEGWHDVESMVEYAPTEGVVPDTWRARHSIRFPSSSISSDFCVYNDGVMSPSGGFNSTRTTRTLSAEQTRFITQQLTNLKAVQDGLVIPRTPGHGYDRDDHRSTKSSYFTARSVERASLKSTHSKTSAQSIRVVHVVHDEKTMKSAAAIYISPPISPVTPRVRARSRSAAAALGTEEIPAASSQPSINVNGTNIEASKLQMGHAFSLDSTDDTISVRAVSLKQFLDFCNEHKSSRITSTAGFAKLLIERKHTFSDDGEVPTMPGGLPPRSNIEVSMRLVPDSTTSTEGAVARVELPATLADISAMLVNCTS